MFFDKLFGKKKQAGKKKQTPKASPQKTQVKLSVEMYANTDHKKEPEAAPKLTTNSKHNILVLYWISKKKKGYDISSNKYPKWFARNYNIDFNGVAQAYIEKGCLDVQDNIATVTQQGQDALKNNSHVIYIYEHPNFGLKTTDFTKAPNFRKVGLNDIVWGVFNARIMDAIKNCMWGDLADTYSNMAYLLIEEKKFEQAADYIFAAAFVETSGLRNGNELAAYHSALDKAEYLPNGLPAIYLLEINGYRVVIPFREIQKELSLDWNTIRDMFLSSKLIVSLESALPFYYFNKEEAFEIFREATERISGGVFSLREVSQKLRWNRPNEHSTIYFYASIQNQTKRYMSQK